MCNLPARFGRSNMRSIAFCLGMTLATAGVAHAQCDKQVRVEQGDTLSSLANRCDVSEARILDLNPQIEGTKDLRAGMTLNLAAPSPKESAAKAREAVETLFGRLKSYASEAGQSIDETADTVRRSIEGFIQRNPDLHQRVRKLGQRLNIPGMEKLEAQVSLSVRKGAPGTSVTLSAIGLPANQRVEVAGGPPEGDYQILESARTSAEGTLQITVELPQQADPQRDFIFVIASPELNLAARSATFDVVAETTGVQGPAR